MPSYSSTVNIYDIGAYGSKIDYLETMKVYKHYTTEESANASYLRIIGQRMDFTGQLQIRLVKMCWAYNKERPALTAEQKIYN